MKSKIGKFSWANTYWLDTIRSTNSRYKSGQMKSVTDSIVYRALKLYPANAFCLKNKLAEIEKILEIVICLSSAAYVRLNCKSIYQPAPPMRWQSFLLNKWREIRLLENNMRNRFQLIYHLLSPTFGLHFDIHSVCRTNQSHTSPPATYIRHRSFKLF